MYTGITWTIFRQSENIPPSMDLLIMSVTDFEISGPAISTTLGGVMSGPVAFLDSEIL